MPLKKGAFRHPLLFLVLLPVFFVGHGYVENYPLIAVKEIIGLLPIYWVAAAALTFISWIFLRNWLQAALLALLMLSIHFFFGAFHDTLKKFTGGNLGTRYTVLLPLLFILVFLCGRWLAKTNRPLHLIAGYINGLLLLLVFVDLLLLISKPKASKSNEPGPLQGMAACINCDKPDIYLVVTDGYAGLETLARLGYDNRPFLDSLRSRGFHVVNNSQANYNFTTFSMASMLNMDWVDHKGNMYDLAGEKGCIDAIAKNRFTSWLQGHGYSFRNWSIFPIDGQQPLVYSPFFRTGEEVITRQTLLGRLDRDVRYNLLTRFHWKSEQRRYARYPVREGNKTLYQKLLEESHTHSASPKFVYAHFNMPHNPYFYKSDGTENPAELLADYQATNAGMYTSYLQYCNGRFLALIDSIKTNSARPPVILFMSDHGYRGTNKNGLEPKQQLNNINAVLLPSGKYAGWYDGMTNINQLRVLLNTQFAQHLPMLRDSSAYLYE
jgi:hypothetical protein